MEAVEAPPAMEMAMGHASSPARRVREGAAARKGSRDPSAALSYGTALASGAPSAPPAKRSRRPRLPSPAAADARMRSSPPRRSARRMEAALGLSGEAAEHLLGYALDSEGPEAIMERFAELERLREGHGGGEEAGDAGGALPREVVQELAMRTAPRLLEAMGQPGWEERWEGRSGGARRRGEEGHGAGAGRRLRRGASAAEVEREGIEVRLLALPDAPLPLSAQCVGESVATPFT